MSDSELEAIRRSKLRELMARSVAKQAKSEKIDSSSILNEVFKGRAWEVFNAASCQFPDVTRKLKPILVDLASSGRLREVTGKQLFLFLRKLGFRVRLNTKINFESHGQLKPLEEKIKESLQKT